MFFIFPKKIVIKSELSQKEFLMKFQENTYIVKETGLFKINRILKNNWATDCYYGTRRENAFTVFHHRPLKRDGGGIRFNGVAAETKDGLVIAGYLRHGIFTYLFSLAWLLVMLLVTAAALVDKPVYALLTLGILIAGLMICYSGAFDAKRLRAYVEILAQRD